MDAITIQTIWVYNRLFLFLSVATTVNHSKALRAKACNYYLPVFSLKMIFVHCSTLLYNISDACLDDMPHKK